MKRKETHNELLFRETVKKVRPDIYVLMDLIDKYHVNVYILFKIIRQLVSVAQGSRWGRVTIYINDNNITQIEGLDSDKVNESIFSVTKS